MNQATSGINRLGSAMLAGIAAIGLAATPLHAQVQTVDPNTAIDADLAPGAPASSTAVQGTPPASQSPVYQGNAGEVPPPPPPADAANGAVPTDATNGTVGTDAMANGTGAAATTNGTAATNTYQEDDLIGAAEGVFGKGAKGLADIIKKVLKDQGQPIGYIVGREASGAVGVGLRYGSGTLHHKIEGERKVYWTGPSIGFDLGGNASNTFVLVYNLYDSEDLYHRYPAAGGAAYFIGGFTASYLRWGKVVLIPIRLGVGYRLGVHVGYMNFTHKRHWLPF